MVFILYLALVARIDAKCGKDEEDTKAINRSMSKHAAMDAVFCSFHVRDPPRFELQGQRILVNAIR